MGQRNSFHPTEIADGMYNEAEEFKRANKVQGNDR